MAIFAIFLASTTVNSKYDIDEVSFLLHVSDVYMYTFFEENRFLKLFVDASTASTIMNRACNWALIAGSPDSEQRAVV